MCFVAIKVVKLTHAIARILEREKIRARGQTTFGAGIAVSSVVFPAARRSWASYALGCSGLNRGVVAASSIPQGVRGSNNSHGCLMVSGTDRFSHGRRQANQRHCQKKIVIWADTMRKMLMSFPMRMLGLRPCISMESQSSSK